jgi:hypothetical protein
MLDDITESYDDLKLVLDEIGNPAADYNLESINAFHLAVNDLLNKLIKGYEGETQRKEINGVPEYKLSEYLQHRRTNEFTFSLSWRKDDDQNVIGVSHKEDARQLPRLSRDYAKVQLHYPVHSVFAEGFNRMFEKIRELDANITDYLAFAKKWAPHSSKLYHGTAWLFCNYLTLKYFCPRSYPESFNKGEVEFVNRFREAGIKNYGHLFIAMGGEDGGSLIYDHSMNGPPVKVNEDKVFPFAIDDEVRRRALELKPEEICVILAFYSWRAVDTWAI